MRYSAILFKLNFNLNYSIKQNKKKKKQKNENVKIILWGMRGIATNAILMVIPGFQSIVIILQSKEYEENLLVH